MSDKITWWPAEMAKSIIAPMIVLMRYDWPDERIYQIGVYDPSKSLWTDGHGGELQTPDYFIEAGNIVPFIHIPAEREYTYKPKITKAPA
jgi:hypothetical protein